MMACMAVLTTGHCAASPPLRYDPAVALVDEMIIGLHCMARLLPDWRPGAQCK